MPHRRAHVALRSHARAHVPGPRVSRLRTSLTACTAEGVVAELAAACTGVGALTAWSMHLGAARWMIGMFGALPFVAQLVQVPAAYIASRFGLRKVAVASITFSRLIYAALVALPFLPIGTSGRLTVFASVIVASAVLGAVGGNAWSSWMGDLVPGSVRGRYFGRRTAFCTLGGACASLLTGAVLDASRRSGHDDVSLGLLAGIIAVAGVVCGLLMRRMHQPRAHHAPAALRWADAALPLADPRGRRAVAFQAAWGMSMGLAGGFCALFMVEELHIGFLGVTLHATAFALARTVAAPLWGRAVDRFGARPVLVTATFGVGLTSIFWLAVAPGLIWLLALDALATGALDAGQLIGGMALPLRIAPRGQRPFYLAAFAMAFGLAFGGAAAAGGAVVSALPGHYGLLFAASTVLKLLAGWFATRLIEPGARPVRELLGLGERQELAIDRIRA